MEIRINPYVLIICTLNFSGRNFKPFLQCQLAKDKLVVFFNNQYIILRQGIFIDFILDSLFFFVGKVRIKQLFLIKRFFYSFRA